MYCNAAGGSDVAVFLLGLFLATEVVNVSGSIWLSLWSIQQWDLSSSRYLQVYLTLVAAGLLSPVLRYHESYRVMNAASLSIHNWLLRSVSTAPMSFFDTTPLGRVLTRFTRDVDFIDNSLQQSLIFFLQVSFQVLGASCITVVSQPLVLFPLLPCAYIYYRLMLYYNTANREVRRVTNNLQAPVIALITESLNGARTILAYQKSRVMLEEAYRRIDRIYAGNYMQNICNRWLGVRIEFLGNLVATSVACAGVFGKVVGFGSNNVGLLSLGLTMSMQITGLLNWIIRQGAAVESDMNSVERMFYYIENIPHEPLPELAIALERGDRNLCRVAVPEIPATIEFQGVCARYREGLPLVLNDLSFRVERGEKIGVVGRTGSGKSTLILSLLRLIETCGGRALVGGHDVKEWPLSALRSFFSVIPQDPILFEGTIRFNLDPFRESEDDGILWDALTHVGLERRIRDDPRGLDAVVTDGGKNFSVGQRQLLCMARALLKKSCYFILMDEATANIDPELDALIQRTVAVAFAGKTVLTVAHRLHTIVEYDRILVMSDGKAVEMGPPAALASCPTSAFRAMIAAQGPEQEIKLLNVILRSTPGP